MILNHRLPHPKTLLVVPCYNEEKRLNLEVFRQFAGETLQFLFVNDGSRDKTAELIRSFITEDSTGYFHFHDLEVNQGKAEAVRQAVRHALDSESLSEFEWYGFWDADLATPLEEVSRFFAFASLYYKPEEVDAIFGSRIFRLGSSIQRSTLRHYFARVFATVASPMLKILSYDSQCGAKLFSWRAADIAFADPFISKWIFDIEIQIRLAGFNMIECPLIEWRDVKGSKLTWKDGFRAFWDLYRIRNHYR